MILDRIAAPLTARLRALPRGWAAVVAVGCVAMGGLLLLRPFRSITVLLVLLAVSLVMLAVGELTRRHGWGRVRAGCWLVLAAAIAFWPAVGVVGIVVIIALGLLLDALTSAASVRRLAGAERAVQVMNVLTGLLLAGLVVLWPDVSLLVIGVLFGAKMLWFGVTLMRDVVRRPRRQEANDGERLAQPRVWRAAVALIVVLGLAGVSIMMIEESPSPDDFYVAPTDRPAEPGRLLRAEPFTQGMPDGVTAWRILYTTTRDEGVSAVASGLVIVPDQSQPGPTIAWAHGTTGVAQGCAPSLLADPLDAGAFPAIDQVVAHGWTVVATDYVGLGTAGPHPYLIGQGEGRSVLDAVRAAHELDQADVPDDTVVWGHSQGGHAALWAGQLAPTYAPDLSITGVAAMAPAADLPALLESLPGTTGGPLFAAYVLWAYAATYDDIDWREVTVPTQRTVLGQLARRCLAEPAMLFSVVTALALGDDLRLGRRSGDLESRLAANVPTGPFVMPVLVAQGAADGLIRPDAQKRYVRRLRREGEKVDYRVYDGRDHLSLVADESPLVADLLGWTATRGD